jgi:adenosylcobinamide-GDP ribazoletransferase
MKRQIHIFLTAVMFYSRIPCPSWVDHDAELLNKATIYFPLIGWIAGVWAALIFWGSSFVFPLEIAVLCSMIASVLLTGAFHEDGFGDTCDGFGGGWTKAKILEIMKDSRVGTYAVVGLILLFGIKFCALKNMEIWEAILALLIAHPLSRWVAVWLIFTMNYARENDEIGAKAKPVAKQISGSEFSVATFFGWVPLIIASIYFANYWLFSIGIGLFLLKKQLERYFTKWIDGYTGDCLGATQQVAEVLIYLTLIIVWKFT